MENWKSINDGVPQEVKPGSVTLYVTDLQGRTIGVSAVFNDLELVQRDPMAAVKKALEGVTWGAVSAILDNRMFK